MYFRVSILGASGSIGSAVLQELSSRRVTARAVNRWSSKTSEFETDRAVADLDDPVSVHDALAGSNAVVFCVSPFESNPFRYAEIKIGYLRRVLDACRDHQVDRFVLVSAADTAADEDGVVAADHFHLPGTKFSFTDARYHCETEVMLRAADGMNASIVLPFLCAGSRDSSRVRPTETGRVVVSEIARVAETIADESLGREMGLRRVVVESRVARNSELEFEPSKNPTWNPIQRVREARRPRRDDALLHLKSGARDGPEME